MSWKSQVSWVFSPLVTGSVDIPLVRYNFPSRTCSPVLRPRLENQLLGSASSLPKNEYTYLDIKPSQAGLMLLCKDHQTDPIQCSLKAVDSRDLAGSGLVYQALSYVWSPEEAGHRILFFGISTYLYLELENKGNGSISFCREPCNPSTVSRTIEPFPRIEAASLKDGGPVVSGRCNLHGSSQRLGRDLSAV